MASVYGSAGLPMSRAFLASLALSAALASGQSFSVASLKPSAGAPAGTPGTDGGPGTRIPTRYATSSTLRGFIFRAYGLDDYQQQISGPKWIDDDKFDIDARMPEGTTKEQFQTMLQNLLVERFKLAVHHETKVIPVYNMVIARNGPKLKESAPAEPASGPLVRGFDSDGFAMLTGPGLISMYREGSNGPVARWSARLQPVSALCKQLNNGTDLNRIVRDKTGLTGKYDFKLSYEIVLPVRAGETPAPKLTLFDALEEQLGLKLVDTKEPVDVVVIDQAERSPVAN